MLDQLVADIVNHNYKEEMDSFKLPKTFMFIPCRLHIHKLLFKASGINGLESH